MTRRQRGVTMIGWIFLLIPVALVLYAGVRVGPNYLDYWKIITAMKETATQVKSDEALTAQSIMSTLSRRFESGYVDNIKVGDVAVVKGDEGWTMTVDYEETEPLFGNLSLLMNFKHTVVIR